MDNNKTKVSEKLLIPEHYTKALRPNYKGPGNHSVRELEKMASDFDEYIHQLIIREQLLLNLLDAEITL